MAVTQPMYYLNPALSNVHLCIFYRNFQKLDDRFSHVGLGVNALHTARVLRRHKVHVDIHGVREPPDIEAILRATPTCTHALIEAPWVATPTLNAWCMRYPAIHFIVRSHSQVGFLVVEPGAIKLIREDIGLQESQLNFTLAGNSKQFKDWIETSYSGHVLYLPNLYDFERAFVKDDSTHDHKLVRISSFGALRLLKNHTTAAAAALMIAKQRNADLEFHISTNRAEGPSANAVGQAIRNMMSSVPGVTLVEDAWRGWPDFRRLVATMDLAIQVSHTETFNLATADATAEGVPSVVTPAIEWAPEHWMADPDDVEDIARIGNGLLWSSREARNGLAALQLFQRNAVTLWLDYLSGQPFAHPSGD